MVLGARKIIWTKRSNQDRKSIFGYWNERNKSTSYSKKLDGLFRKKMAQIAENPFLGRPTNLLNIRIVVVRDNLLVYEILDDKILILRVWEGHQNQKNFDY